MSQAALIISIGLFALLFIQMIWLASRYIKCPPGKVMIISGRVEKPNKFGVEILTSGAQFVWPVIQEHSFLDLKIYEKKLEEKFSLKNKKSIPIKSTLSYGISTEKNILANAANRLAEKTEAEIESLANSIIHSKMNETFQDTDEEFFSDSKNIFKEKVVNNINDGLKVIGMEIINFDLSE